MKGHTLDEMLFTRVGDQIEHTVPMSDLSKTPFNMDFGELIVV